MLCGMLAAAGGGDPDSYFGRPWIPDFARDFGMVTDGDIDALDFNKHYLDAVLVAGRAGSGPFGLRVMQDTVDDLSARLDMLFPGLANAPDRFERAFGRPLYIHLSRRDKVAQAVSLYKATRTGLWHRAADGSELERTARHRDAAYDAGAISALVGELETRDDAWRRWFARHGIAPLAIAYEDFSRDPRSGLRAILLALELDAARADAVEPSTARLADDENARWVARFRIDHGL